MRKNILYAYFLGTILMGSNVIAQTENAIEGNTTLKTLIEDRAFNPQTVNVLLNEMSNGLYKEGVWVETESNPDHLGQTHFKYQLHFKGIPVLRHVYTVHVENLIIKSISGEVSGQSLSNDGFVLSASQAKNNAIEAIGAKSYMWQNSAAEAHLKIEQHDPNASFAPNGVQFWLATDSGIKPVWRFDIYAEQPLSRNYVFVNAINGEIVEKAPRIHHANGIATSAYSGTVNIETDSIAPSVFHLHDQSRGGGITTWDLNNATSYGGAVNFQDADNVWNSFSPMEDIYAIDAHWGAEKTYDYYFLEHGRNSINNLGFPLNSYVHYDVNYANAFWDGSRMTYGDGDSQISALTTADISGHEITHGLTEFTANLIYSYESGALNESYSDIFGTAIEFYAKPQSADWLVGAEIGYTLRSMSNPKQYGDPNCYNGQNWHTAPSDNGGVHINSGVQNFWYYLLVNGGTDVNDLGNSYSVNGIGMTKASAIAFRTLTVYLTPSSNFMDARNMSIQSAIDLYGNCSNEATQVANAWYAVGVGGNYQTTVDADFAASQKQACIAPLTVTFSNLSSHGISYFWDFGDGTTSTLATPTHTYTQNGNYTVKLVTYGGSCGDDSIVVADYIKIDPDQPCVTQMVKNGTTATQLSCSGLILDSGGEGMYENDTRDQITIAPIGAGKVILHFDEFDIEAGLGNNCNYDVLKVYDGTSINAVLIAQYCNNQLPPDSLIVANPQGAVTLVFESDNAVTNNGFKIRYDCEQSTLIPKADFTANLDSTCRGEVMFEDQTLNGATSWSWNFGDGTTSSSQNPTHWYKENGVYTVTMEATNAIGSDIVTKVNRVAVNTFANGGISKTIGTNGQPDVLTSINSPGTSYWYDDLSQAYLDTGAQFVVPTNASNLIYLIQSSNAPAINGAKLDNTGGGGMFNNVQGLIFDVYTATTLKSVKVYSGTSANRLIILKDNTGAIIENKLVFIPNGESRVALDLDIAVGTNYELTVDNNETINLFRNNSGVTYPYNVGNLAQIKRSTANTNPSGYYYFFYDWEMTSQSCLSEVDSAYVNGATNVNNAVSDQLSVYPNPATSQVSINFKSVNNFSIEVLNVAGQVIYNQKNISQLVQINTQTWAKGVYVVNVTTSGMKHTQKLVIH